VTDHEHDHLTHLDDEGRARMIDVGAKPVTHRVAVAGGRLWTTPEVIALVRADGLPKADVLATARIAGIAGAKRTSELIPLAHLLPLDGVTVDFDLGTDSIEIRASVSVTARTGVEMEALTAVSVACLTIYDMIKAVERGVRIEGIHLIEKKGGKSGHYRAGD
jgi:cyclic pyranopterin phosphate synthase